MHGQPDPVVQAADNVRLLTQSFTHSESYPVWDHKKKAARKRWRVHRTVQPPLLAQLKARANAAYRAEAPEESGAGGHGVAGSRPAADLAAIAALVLIEQSLSRWLARMGSDVRPSGNLAQDMRALVGALPNRSAHTQRAVADSFTRWVALAETVTGWRTPAWKPDVRCPHCADLPGEDRGLRIQLDMRTARCLSCKRTWDPVTIRLLARQITDDAGHVVTQPASA